MIMLFEKTKEGIFEETVTQHLRFIFFLRIWVYFFSSETV